MVRKSMLNIIFLIVCCALIISLVVNIVYVTRLSREHQREHQFTHMLYNQLKSDVMQAAPRYSSVDIERASVNMAYAASVLNDLFIQSSGVNNQKTTQEIEQDASFVSYLSLALVGQNEKYIVGQKTVTITPSQAKNLVTSIRQIVFKNVVNGSDIPDNKIDAVYKGIHNLIPSDFKSVNGLLGSFNR